MKIVENLVVIFLCSIILLTGLWVYFSHFNGTFSTIPSEYGFFGDYFNPFLTLTSVVLLGYISFKANYITKTFNDIQLQPILFINMEESEIKSDIQDWFVVCNGYEAPAINVLVRITIKDDKKIYKTKWVNCFSLQKENKIKLPWIRHAKTIEIIWTDLLEENFFKIIYEDWIRKVDTANKQDYDTALARARETTIKTDFDDQKKMYVSISNFLSKDFKNHFFETDAPTTLGKDTYIEYLKQIKMFED